jgi:hypothetical protein
MRLTQSGENEQGRIGGAKTKPPKPPKVDVVVNYRAWPLLARNGECRRAHSERNATKNR